jgi:hypothetical protein
MEGAILGFSEEGFPPNYGVAVFKDDSPIWDFPTVMEEDLESTGRFDRYDRLYDGTRITVSENGELLEWHDPPDTELE